MKLRLLLFISTIVAITSIEAQTCASSSRNPWDWPGNQNWFVAQFSGGPVGGAQHINFNGGFSKTPLSQNMAVYEGTTAASNDQGGLVLFSNGKYAWDAGGNITSTTIKEGDEQGGVDPITGNKHSGSASQGVMTVRHPLVPNKYFVVAVGDVIGGGAPGVNYNVFDETGTEIQGPTSLGVTPCEGIDATLHENGVDVWVTVLGYNSTNFHSFLLTCNGFVTPGVTSAVGDARVVDAGRGGLAFSPDGTKMTACFPDGWPNADRQIQVYNFDKKTGKLSNRQNLAPPAVVIGPYDCIWSKDGSSVIVTGGNSGKAHSLNVTTGVLTQNIAGIGGGAHTVQIGGDGNYYFSGADGLWQWTGSGNATKVDDATGWGLPTIYIPPAEEPIITPPASMCDTSGTVDLSTVWVCSGLNAEDTISTNISKYESFKINAPGDTSAVTTPGIVFSGAGIFDPRLAGKGEHLIVFSRCAVDDSIVIVVTECVQCIDTLKTITPEICAGPGGVLNLATLIDTANAKGYWTFGSVPGTPTIAAIIDSSTTDTLFSAVDPTTSYGVYEMIYTVTNTPLVCKDTINIIVNKPPVISVNNDTICLGDPAVTFTASSDSLSTNYEWNAVAGSDSTTTGNTAGEYRVFVTDTNGCTGRDTGLLVVNALPVISVNDSTICAGDPGALFTASSDSLSTNYEWNGVAGSDSTITGTTAGEYRVFVTDTNGCTGRDTGLLVINALPVISVNDTTICAGAASALFTASSDSLSTSYEWNGTPGADSTIIGTTAGEYRVLVTDTNGCTGRDTGLLVINALPVVSVNDSTICTGATGGALFTASSDSLSTSYEWNGVAGSDSTIIGTTAGEYRVLVTDTNGCQGRDTGLLFLSALPVISVNDSSICIGDPAALFTASSDSLSTNYEWNGTAGTDSTTTGAIAGNYVVVVTDIHGCTGTATGVLVIDTLPIVSVNSDTICLGDGNVTFSATSSSLIDVYQWSGNGFGNQPAVTGNQPGHYTVTVTDFNGCQAQDSGKLVVNALPVVTVNDSTICAGGASALFTASVDTIADLYVWSGNGTGSGPVDSTTVGTTAGDYTATVTDKNGCISSGTGSLTLSALPVVSVSNEEICAGGTAATFTVTSDVAVASYAWSGNSSVTSDTATGTAPGNYTVNIIDVNGCTGNATGVLTVHDLPVVTMAGGTACPGAPFTFTPAIVSIANNPPAYLWDTGETSSTLQRIIGTDTVRASVTITDAKGCFKSVTATVVPDANLTPLIPGPISICQGATATLTSNYTTADGYSFAWTDGSTPIGTSESVTVNSTGTYGVFVSRGLCNGTGSVSVTVNQLPTVTVNNASICFGDPAAGFTASSTIAGSAKIASWLWSGQGTGTDSTTTGSTPGNYTVVVTDDSSCTATGTGVLTVNALPTVVVDSTSICFGDPAALFTATTTIAGSANIASWSWSGQGSGSAQTTTGNTPGNYTVTVTDDSTCAGSGTGLLTVNALPVVTVADQERCESDPAVTFSAGVDSAVTSYLWSGLGSGSAQTFSGTTPGNYTVTVVDVNKCVRNKTAVLTENPNPPFAPYSAAMCEGDPTLIGTAITDGGTYTYSWTKGSIPLTETGPQISVSTKDLYTRTANSADNCSSASTYDVAPIANPQIIIKGDTLCAGEDMLLTDQLSKVGFKYIWNPGVIIGDTIFPTSNQKYTVEKIDTTTTSNCSSKIDVRAKFIEIPSADIEPDTVRICKNDVAKLVVQNTGSSQLWNNNGLGATNSVTTQGHHSVIVSNGECEAYDTVYVEVVEYPISYLDQTPSLEAICFRDLEEELWLTANLDEDLNYLWNTGETTNMVEALDEGVYSFTLSRDLGEDDRVCAITDSIILTSYCPFTFYVPNAFTPNGNGPNDIFYAYGTHIITFEMNIYDRWGLKIFKSSNINSGWNGRYYGRDVQEDVYVWKINFTVETFTGSYEDYSKVGTVTLIR